MKKFYDFLGNELFDGDEVITIKKKGRAAGGDLVKVRVKIVDDELKFHYARTTWNLYKTNLGRKCYKVQNANI